MKQVVTYRLQNLLKSFFASTRAVGAVLLCCTVLSLVLSNMQSIGAWYRGLFLIHFLDNSNHVAHVSFLRLPNSPLFFINDVLMPVFFFLVGMEIKYEFLKGELVGFKKSILPIAAAVGGMVVPMMLFLFINKGTPYREGWGIPSATDIAFTLGALSLLGSRIPVSLKIFLTAAAIIDDLGAIIVIALFYGGQINFLYLLLAMVCLALLYLLNKYKVKFGVLQFLIAIVLWYTIFNSGLHTTVAGILFAFMIPTKLVHDFSFRLQHFVNFGIIPLFALANTAILLPTNVGALLGSTLSIGIGLGLIIGKPIGICIATWLLVRSKITVLPTGLKWTHLIGGGMLAGIGFTMSIFISTLAFEDNATQDIAKIAVLVVSTIAMVVGLVWLRIYSPVIQKKASK